MTPPRLPLSVLAALGLCAGPRCADDEPEALPCLSPVMDTDTPQPPLETCLTVMPEPPIGPCLSPPPEPALHPCLRMAVPDDPLPEPPEPERSVRPCLDYNPEPLDASGDKASPQRKLADDLLDRGVLPEDVAERLRKRRQE